MVSITLLFFYLSSMKSIVEIFDAGRMDYREAWDLQRRLQAQLIEQKLNHRKDPSLGKPITDTLLFVEHPHVYTLGKSGDAAHLLKGLSELRQIDAEFIENDRGGDITYHGPGQVVGYPILDLDRHFTDVHKYLRYLEEVIIMTCADFGVKAGRIDGLTGVWVDDQKVCAMGIRCSRWVTMHGFALNVAADLTYFDHIVPCGIRDKKVTGLDRLLKEPVDIEEVKHKLSINFARQFGVEVIEGKNIRDLNQKLANTTAGIE